MAIHKRAWTISIAALVVLIAGGVLVTYRLRGRSSEWDALRSGDYAQAARLLRGAADKGDARAQYALGLLYADGTGIAKNEALSAAYLRQAAGQGHAGAAYKLASLYEYGRGVSEDRSAAFRWYLYAAQRGEASAQYKIASLYDAERQVARES